MARQKTSWWQNALALVFGAPFLILLSPFLLLLLLGMGIHHVVWTLVLRWRFWRRWRSLGRVALVAYSDSPKWKDYIETQMLPPIRDRVVTLNWSAYSEARKEMPLEAHMVRHYGGRREYNPIAIVVPRFGRVRLIRFWQAFGDFKNGKREPLEKLQAQLLEAVRGCLTSACT